LPRLIASQHEEGLTLEELGQRGHQGQQDRGWWVLFELQEDHLVKKLVKRLSALTSIRFERKHRIDGLAGNWEVRERTKLRLDLMIKLL